VARRRWEDRPGGSSCSSSPSVSWPRRAPPMEPRQPAARLRSRRRRCASPPYRGFRSWAERFNADVGTVRLVLCSPPPERRVLLAPVGCSRRSSRRARRLRSPCTRCGSRSSAGRTRPSTRRSSPIRVSTTSGTDPSGSRSSVDTPQRIPAHQRMVRQRRVRRLPRLGRLPAVRARRAMGGLARRTRERGRDRDRTEPADPVRHDGAAFEGVTGMRRSLRVSAARARIPPRRPWIAVVVCTIVLGVTVAAALATGAQVGGPTSPNCQPGWRLRRWHLTEWGGVTLPYSRADPRPAP